jgi:hypothetical protein
VVAAAWALVAARERGEEVLLVDLAGDLPAVLGLDHADLPGVTDWLSADGDVAPDALARLEVTVLPGLQMLPRGQLLGEGVPRVELLADLLAGESRTVVVDCGCLDGLGSATTGATGELAYRLAAESTHSLLVTRACYLALRRAQAVPLRGSGVVLVEEDGRALDRRDVEEVLGVEVRATVAVEPAVARAVDAGLLVSRLPRSLARAVRRAA